ncbi:MAG: GIY-YIG nuclease family protein [Ascidiaceihabitans sp.]|nr:GIY-YIG nuclease family protein [Ascidiaceihabitans sp.]
MSKGWVYALRSDTCDFIKIGLTSTSPFQRVNELNHSINYGPLGPWQQLDIRQVKDVRSIETALHRRLQAKRVTTIAGAQELFAISPAEARAAFADIPDADLLLPVPVNRLNLDTNFVAYLMALFQNSGLENFRDLQESWTFSLFPSTNGGRYFTLNIDRHEVAFCMPIPGEPDIVHHSIIVDQMIAQDREFKNWLRDLGGWTEPVPHPSNWGNARKITLQATFEECLGLFANTGFRRALIAYWYEALLRMQERGTRSFFARFHNYDATSEIFRHLRETKNFRARMDSASR